MHFFECWDVPTKVFLWNHRDSLGVLDLGGYSRGSLQGISGSKGAQEVCLHSRQWDGGGSGKGYGLGLGDGPLLIYSKHK